MAEWSYALTPREEAIAMRVGFQRQEPMFAQPERNRNYSEGDVWETWQHAVAAGSEIAAARMLGLTDFVPHVNTFKSRQDIPDYEVRYCFTRNINPRWALRFKQGVDSLDEIYVLITDGIEKRTRRTIINGWVGPAFVARGWFYGWQCVSPAFVARYGGNSFEVPFDQLWSMDLLPKK